MTQTQSLQTKRRISCHIIQQDLSPKVVWESGKRAKMCMKRDQNVDDVLHRMNTKQPFNYVQYWIYMLMHE